MKLRKFWGVRIVMCVICFGKNESGENLLVTDGWYLKKQSETKNINPQQKEGKIPFFFIVHYITALRPLGFISSTLPQIAGSFLPCSHTLSGTW